jgi:hypothetical protein
VQLPRTRYGVSERWACRLLRRPADEGPAFGYHGAVVSFWRGRPWRINPPRVVITCIVCGKQKHRMRSDIRLGQHTFCGPACRTIWRMLVGVQRLSAT